MRHFTVLIATSEVQVIAIIPQIKMTILLLFYFQVERLSLFCVSGSDEDFGAAVAPPVNC